MSKQGAGAETRPRDGTSMAHMLLCLRLTPTQSARLARLPQPPPALGSGTLGTSRPGSSMAGHPDTHCPSPGYLSESWFSRCTCEQCQLGPKLVHPPAALLPAGPPSPG